VEIDKMTRISIAVAAAALVLGAPLAFAANENLPSQAAMNTIHCTNLETPSPIDGSATNYSSGREQAAQEQAIALCRWDYHKNGSIHAFNEATKPAPHGTTPLMLVRR